MERNVLLKIFKLVFLFSLFAISIVQASENSNKFDQLFDHGSI